MAEGRVRDGRGVYLLGVAVLALAASGAMKLPLLRGADVDAPLGCCSSLSPVRIHP